MAKSSLNEHLVGKHSLASNSSLKLIHVLLNEKFSEGWFAILELKELFLSCMVSLNLKLWNCLLCEVSLLLVWILTAEVSCFYQIKLLPFIMEFRWTSKSNHYFQVADNDLEKWQYQSIVLILTAKLKVKEVSKSLMRPTHFCLTSHHSYY